MAASSCVTSPGHLRTRGATDVEGIGHTMSKGLQVRAELEPNQDPAGIKVSDAAPAAVGREPASVYDEWNDTLRPTHP
jgi:hypothetical protein